jgi:TctA family transporter
MARFSFGIPELTDGIGFVVLAVGLFAVGEIISNLGEKEEAAIFTNKVSNLYPNWKDIKDSFGAICRGTASARSSACCQGRVPRSRRSRPYMVEKKVAKASGGVRQGCDPGVAGPESANNADAQCKFIPTLTLGIPASAVMALMLGALTIQGIAPGPQVMTQKPDLFWGLIASMWVGNLMLVLLNLPMIGCG